ncbi:dicarboxylate/amino acid:cation symporter [Desulfuribacillus alkaliarsenatis]|uniref:Sodium:proton antiporter n=1 Tax=Desulfuribacillus alkaliarsenatis TaxID=766136 RepID=A0A1E5G1G6_9FIRM|nr:dicarboxylate/amino acid:cation symporter [Desulfuribacillus alkaliarsenatis]OEF96676.1 sodium:proton antiporter [Desulfuribacillus alkaliarsenatis]
MQKFGLLPRLIAAILLGIVIGTFLPEWVIRVLVTFNGIFGSFLSFIIPLIIIGFIAPGIGDLGRKAGKMLGINAGIAYVSTVIAGTLAFFVSIMILPNIIEVGSFITGGVEDTEAIKVLPIIELAIPPIMGVITALVLAFTLGLGIAAIPGDTLKNFMADFQGIIKLVITKVIIPLLPIHILGIFANMTYGGQVGTVLSVFAKVFVMVIAIHIIYIIFQYTVASSVGGGNPFKLIRTMLPAYFTAIGTQSSAATIPVTLRQTKRNGIKDEVADFAVPLSATIHLSGSTISLVACAIAIMFLTGMDVAFGALLPFILMLAVTMVAAPGVPGGAVMAALGLLESMLLFDPTLISLMIALYLAQDSFGTAANVTGDGAIAVIMNKISGNKLEDVSKDI